MVRGYVYIINAASPREDRLASLVMPWIDSEGVSIFLSHTAKKSPNNLTVLIFDGAGWHRTKDLRGPKKMIFIPLPP